MFLKQFVRIIIVSKMASNTIRTIVFAALITTLCGAHQISPGEKNTDNKPPSIILITVDSLRADHLGCYGYPKETSPSIDRLAKNALIFENCLSHASETTSSCASFLSGFLPHETKAYENLKIPAEVETLPEMLLKHDYMTLAVISNFVLRKKRGYEQGFLVYDDTMENYEAVRRIPERIAEHTTNKALELLKQHCQSPVFMWIHYQDSHGPYTPPEPYQEMFKSQEEKSRVLRWNNSQSGQDGIPSYQRLGKHADYHYYLSQYDSEIRYLDEEIGRLISGLKDMGLYDEALIIFSSDHGEGMGEHNYYFAHGEHLYNPLIHVPLIIKHGDALIGRRPEYVQHIDLVPTILKFLGLKEDSRFRGQDLFQPQDTKQEIFSEIQSLLVEDGIKFSLVYDGLKLLYSPLNRFMGLYDLKADPEEKNNLVAETGYSLLLADMKMRFNRLLNEDFLGVPSRGKPYQPTKKEKEKLRALGYWKK